MKIKEGNYEYPRKVIKGADVGPVTLEQGVQLTNSDFYDWIRKAVVGRVAAKTLLIVQFTRISELGGFAALKNVVGAPSSITKGLGGQAIAGNIEFTVRAPGRAWLLKQCRPSMYKPGSDFDAMSQDISIASIDIEAEELEEINLGI